MLPLLCSGSPLSLQVVPDPAPEGCRRQGWVSTPGLA